MTLGPGVVEYISINDLFFLAQFKYMQSKGERQSFQALKHQSDTIDEGRR